MRNKGYGFQIDKVCSTDPEETKWIGHHWSYGDVLAVEEILLTQRGGIRFRLLDGDDEVCYIGRYVGLGENGDLFAPLDVFGSPNAGCTSIEYFKRTPDGGYWERL